METIEGVIRIPKEQYESGTLVQYFGCYSKQLDEVMYKGTVLPKGHGVLKDVTNLMRGLYTDMQTIEDTFTSSDVYKMIDEECPIIIEADKESEE